MTYTLVQLGRKALVGAKGGAKFLGALATSNIADDPTVEARRSVCRTCPSRTRDGGSDWCGVPLEEHLEAGNPAPTCGCLVYGKTLVASEDCPQGRWPYSAPTE